MLEAKKNYLFEKIFAIYNKNLLKRKFHSLNISGLEKLKTNDISLPILFYANHSSWWDGLIAFQISELLNFDSYVLMEEKQLENLRFFRKLGAFSIVREKPRQAFESLEYIVGKLKSDPRKSLWIFPQGEILPNDVRPINFYNGLAHIVKKIENCKTFPIAVRLEFLGNFKPEIFIKIGEPDLFSGENNIHKKSLTLNFSEKLSALLDEVKNDVLENNLTTYQNIL